MNNTWTSALMNISSIMTFRVDTLDIASKVLSSLLIFICVCGMIGNGLVVWLLSCQRQRTPFCTYVLNLAVADFLFLLCTAAHFTPHNMLLFFHIMERVRFFTYTASLSLLTAMSAQRCLSVLFPIWYKCHQPQYLSTVVCALLWVLSLLMNLLPSLFCSKDWIDVQNQCFMTDFVFSVLILGIFIPVMTLSSVTLVLRVRRSSQQWGRQQPTRLYVVIVTSVGVFLVCTLTLGISWIFLYWLGLPYEQKSVFHDMACLSSALSSSANPVIYFVVGSQGCQGLWEPMGAVLRRALKEEPDGEGRETASTGTNQLGA